MPEGNPALDALPFHSNNKPIPFYLGPFGHFSSGCFRADLTAIAGALFFCQFFFFPSHFPPCILYHDIPSEPAVTVF